MPYAIEGFGAAGQALARVFARKALEQGGALVQARGRVWAPVIFQDLFRAEQ